jgi:hypothetical protein
MKKTTGEARQAAGDVSEVAWMVGRAVSCVTAQQNVTWQFSLGRDAGFDVDCPWRLLERGKMLLGSEDPGRRAGLSGMVQEAARMAEQLSQVTITKVEIREGTRDLVIDFSGDRRLEILPCSGLRPGWRVRSAPGETISAHGEARPAKAKR